MNSGPKLGLILARNYENGPWLTNLGPKLPKRTMIDRFGPKTIKTDRDRWIRARNLVNGLIFEVSDPDWSITIRLRGFGPKLVNHGLFSHLRAKIGQSRFIF